MAKYKVTANTGSVEIEAYDIEEAIRKFKDLNNSAEIESVENTDKW